MNCPLCLDTVLDITYHAGIELDICPKCRGVWLDRGELNRIVDELGAPARASSPGRGNDGSRPPGQLDRHRRANRDDHRGKKRRKKSFASRLGEAFEEIVDL
jgi:Zn-finger nucleic acid-binding protein